MIPIVPSLYGFAGFLCLIGYIYALLDWHRQQRSLECTTRLSLTGSGTTHATASAKETIAKMEEVKSDVQEVHRQDGSMTFHMAVVSGTESKQSAMAIESEETSREQSYLSIGQPDMESQISEPSSSWDQRRAKRRQRYREEKSRLIRADDVELEDVESQETITEDLDNRTPTGQFDEQEFILVSSVQEAEGNLYSMRKYSIPEEIRVAHSTCSRRTSVQITDLDEQWHTATVHVEEESPFQLVEIFEQPEHQIAGPVEIGTSCGSFSYSMQETSPTKMESFVNSPMGSSSASQKLRSQIKR